MATVAPHPPRVSYSELDAFRQCPHMHWLAYREKWEPEKESAALTRGKVWHALLATHYRGEKIDPAEWFYFEDGSQSEELETLEWMWDGYQQMWGQDKDWKVVHVEYKVAGWLPNLEGKPSKIKDVAVVDLIVKDKRGGMWLIDHKSSKDLLRQERLDMEDQWGQYVWIMRHLGKPVQGIIANVARTYRYKSDREQPLEERFQRIMLYRSDSELDVIAQEAFVTAKKILAVKTKEQAERHTGEHCQFRCSFRDACLGSRKGIDEDEFLESTGFRRRT